MKWVAGTVLLAAVLLVGFERASPRVEAANWTTFQVEDSARPMYFAMSGNDTVTRLNAFFLIGWLEGCERPVLSLMLDIPDTLGVIGERGATEVRVDTQLPHQGAWAARRHTETGLLTVYLALHEPDRLLRELTDGSALGVAMNPDVQPATRFSFSLDGSQAALAEARGQCMRAAGNPLPVPRAEGFSGDGLQI